VVEDLPGDLFLDVAYDRCVTEVVQLLQDPDRSHCAELVKLKGSFVGTVMESKCGREKAPTYGSSSWCTQNGAFPCPDLDTRWKVLLGPVELGRASSGGVE
jgi:hypothetical protein